MIQPGLYAQEVDLSLSGIGDQIGDGLSAGIFPVWRYSEKGVKDGGTPVSELYLSDGLMARLAEENETANADAEISRETLPSS